MIETVIDRNLPRIRRALCMAWRREHLPQPLHRAGPHAQWTSTCAYKFHGLFMKMMGFFCGGKIRGSHMTFLRNFKGFAEEGKDVRDSA